MLCHGMESGAAFLGDLLLALRFTFPLDAAWLGLLPLALLLGYIR